MSLSLMILGLVALGAVLWVLLDRHERRRAAADKPRHSPLRLIFAAAALLTVLFSGGCGLLFLANMDGQYVTWQVIATLAGPPFIIGLLVWWLSMRRKAG
jgi:protein-S-isoprenylcysteine O-methyltransferase Ste14